ncbi:metallophosphoesterase [Xenophilus sp. Marseille-Q4582]|uniref:metallophosphoesterase n=1 Tax=Xenophilus sp. Marseille-Q4582 TaxID=2866600 RepID=UPI001CE47E2D|nr:metallophosphoesterase [Xenophilus sp. Marseille-Q4582]
MNSSSLVAALPGGPLDLVGDVHGELAALESLLAAAGYDADGHHPDGRHLVIVGDLVDRGPDSPGVVWRVKQLVDSGRASAILGNHELNILRGQRKAGNDWFWGEHRPGDQAYEPFQRTDPAQDPDMLAFFRSLPLALERADLRVVHAVWDAPSIDRLRTIGFVKSEGLAALFERFEGEARNELERQGIAAAAERELAAWKGQLGNPAAPVPMLHAVGRQAELQQMLNPLRVLTSGVERCAQAPFFASQEWRFAVRERWWDAYGDPVPVVVGHYWRQYLPLDRAELGKGDPDLFKGIAATHWLGDRGLVFCVDYSVGGRYKERGRSPSDWRTRLAALRWPENVLILEDGEEVPTTGFLRADTGTA